METANLPSEVHSIPLKYSGNGNELALLLLKNLFLTIITFGIYHAWARTNFRRYVWGHVSFLGDRAAYTGTGEELFRGWIKLLGIFLVGYIVIRVGGTAIPFINLLILPIYGLIFALAAYSGLRYRMSRTVWRQIRFGVDKNKELTKEYLKLYYWNWFLTLITFGFFYPWFKNRVRKFLTDKCRFGSEYFYFDGGGSEYAGIYFWGVFLSTLTLGLYLPWFIRKLALFRLQYTSFQGQRFRLKLRGSDLLFLGIVGYFGSLLTLGLATPWILNWGFSLFINNIEVDGSLALEKVVGLPSEGSAMADDFASAYDIDLGF